MIVFRSCVSPSKYQLIVHQNQMFLYSAPKKACIVYDFPEKKKCVNDWWFDRRIRFKFHILLKKLHLAALVTISNFAVNCTSWPTMSFYERITKSILWLTNPQWASGNQRNSLVIQSDSFLFNLSVVCWASASK